MVHTLVIKCCPVMHPYLHHASMPTSCIQTSIMHPHLHHASTLTSCIHTDMHPQDTMNPYLHHASHQHHASTPTSCIHTDMHPYCHASILTSCIHTYIPQISASVDPHTGHISYTMVHILVIKCCPVMHPNLHHASTPPYLHATEFSIGGPTHQTGPLHNCTHPGDQALSCLTSMYMTVTCSY